VREHSIQIIVVTWKKSRDKKNITFKKPSTKDNKVGMEKKLECRDAQNSIIKLMHRGGYKRDDTIRCNI